MVAAEATRVISSTRGLVVLATVTVILALALALDVSRTPAAVESRELVRMVDDAFRTITWIRGAERTVVSATTGRWELVEPVRLTASMRQVSDVLHAAFSARWHRRGSRSDAGEVTATVTIEGRHRVEIGLGAAIPGSEMQWLVVNGEGRLVDRWVARALMPPVMSLVDTRPFAHVSAASAIRVTRGGRTIELRGRPRRSGAPRIHAGGEATLVDTSLVAALEDAIAGLELTAIEPAAAATTATTAIDVDGVIASLGGACGAGRVRFGIGERPPTCVDAASAAHLDAALDRLDRDDVEIADRRPVPFDVAALTLVDGTIVDVTRRPTVDGRDADPRVVADLREALVTPGTVVRVPAGAEPSARSLSVIGPDGVKLVLDLRSGQLVHRRGEPTAIRVSAEVWRKLGQRGSALASRVLWIEEPLSIATVSVHGTSYERGAVAGEWTKGGGPTTETEARQLDALVTFVAAPRSLGDATWPASTPGVEVVVGAVGPVGPVVTHRLDVLISDRARCLGRTREHGELVLAPRLCELVRSLSTQPRPPSPQ